MNKEFIPYEIALSLKGLGFDEPCFTYYYDDNGKIRTGLSIHINNGWTYKGTKKLETTLAPTFSQAFRWFREKYKLVPEIRNWNGSENQWYYMIFNQSGELLPWRWVEDKTYEETELACLKKLIEIVKNQNS